MRSGSCETIPRSIEPERTAVNRYSIIRLIQPHFARRIRAIQPAIEYVFAYHIRIENVRRGDGAVAVTAHWIITDMTAKSKKCARRCRWRANRRSHPAGHAIHQRVAFQNAGGDDAGQLSVRGGRWRQV